MSDTVPPPIPTIPPPLPAQRDRRTPLTRTGITGVDGMTIEQLQQAIANGGKFVVYQYCISILVMTFKRSSGITFLRPGQSVFGSHASYSAISMFFGWWGIPWGPIWTISTLAKNFGGGQDVTREVME